MEKFWLDIASWMFIWCQVLLGLLTSTAVVSGSNQEHCFVPAPSNEDTDPCPPWFIQQKIADDNTTVECVCGFPVYGIKCDPKTCNTSLGIRYCMTYDPVTGAQAGGKCIYKDKSEIITTLPSNLSILNDFMCGSFNREGQLCGSCKKGYGPALIPTSYECAKCSTKNYGWVLYIFLEFLPVTVFYLIIVGFQVSATSGPLNAFIFSAQIIASTIKNNNLVLTAYSSQSLAHIMSQVLITFYGIWNLDFFHPAIPPFCVSENITTLHALALQYLPAFYPLLLIVVTYILIELHDRNVRVVVWMWKPFQKCMFPLQKHLRWNPKASIVGTFATFLTLAYNKLIIVSAELLNGSKVTDIRGNSSQYLLLAPTVPYFGKQHLPYAILAIVVFSTFIALPPLLLISYPTKAFQKLLGCMKMRWPALHIFADVFQGCYRNRTDSTNDYRYFAAYYFIMRVVIFLFKISLEFRLSWIIPTIVLIIGSLLFALLRPYKKNWLNVLDSLILASLALASLWIFYSIETHRKWTQLAGFIATLPLVYFVTYTVGKLFSWLELRQKCQQRSGNICQSLQLRWQGHYFGQQGLCDGKQLSDRMLNSCECQPLLHNIEQR